MSLYQNNQLTYSFSSKNQTPENIEDNNQNHKHPYILIQDNICLSNNNDIHLKTFNSFLKNTSDNEQKINKLNSRLDKIFEQVNFEKQQNTSIINYSINSKEISLKVEQNRNIQKIKKLKIKMQYLSSLFSRMKNNTKNNQIQINDFLTSFENKFNKKIKQIENQRNKTEFEMSDLINRQFSNLRNNYINIGKENDKNLKNTKENILKQIKFLFEQIENEKKHRKIKDEEMHKIILNKIKEYENVCRNETKMSENRYENLIQDIQNNLKDFDFNLRKLKNDRELSYKNLSSIAEKTRDQIQMKI